MTCISPPQPSFGSLPNEIILLTANNLEDPSHISSLIRTSRHLANLITPLLHHHAVQDRGVMTALGWASMKGYTPLAKLLLSKGVDIDHSGPRSLSPLHYAAGGCHLAIMSLLIDHGAKIEARDPIFARTPLHMAVYTPESQTRAPGAVPGVVQKLLQSGANPTSKSPSSQTPMHMAAMSRLDSRAVIDILVEFGASVDEKDDWGSTPLHRAGCIWNEEAIDALLKHGADIKVVESMRSRRRAREASIEKHNEMVKKLRSRAALLQAPQI